MGVSHLLIRWAGFARNERGSISLVAALLLPALAGFVSLAAEYGRGLAQKGENQRVADLATYAAALAYNAQGSTAAMTAAAQQVAALNGLAPSAVTATLGPSPTDAQANAVTVRVLTSVPVLVGPALGGGRTLQVAGQATAQLSAQATACIIALQSTGGIVMSGGTSLSAPSCQIASNASLTVPCGTTVSAKSVSWATTAPSQPCNGITGPTARATTADPLANHAGIDAAQARAAGIAASVTGPASPTVPTGTNIDFAYRQSDTIAAAAAAGCTASMSGNTWTLTCPQTAGASYNFGTVTMGGGITLNWNVGGAATTTYNFSGAFKVNGTAVTAGPGRYNMAGGLATDGGTTTVFGTDAAGSVFNIGASSAACNGAGRYSLCNLGTSLVLKGSSTFTLSAGLYNKGGSTLTLGSGSANSFHVGASSDGNALWLGGGSKTTLADATGGSSRFTLAGNLNVASGGGSCVWLGAAAEHDIKGFVALAGGTTLGAGVWSASGYIALGMGGGGDVTCDNNTVGLAANGVTIVTAGQSTPASSTCAGKYFCVAAGYGNVTVTAPTSGPLAKVAVVGPDAGGQGAAGSSAGAMFTAGSSGNKFSGAFYIPNGPLTLSGAANLGAGAGSCLQIVASTITMSGGSATGSNCISLATTTPAITMVR